MCIIKLRPVTVTPKILSFLERRDLIRTLKPSKKLSRIKQGRGCVQTQYRSSPRFGSHKLICVGLNSNRIKLTSHPDNEEFIIVNNTGRKFKPLYMIIGLYKKKAIEKKAKDKELSRKDFMALRLKYNGIRTSIFTMLKDTPHCEITTESKGVPPVFFVTEPSNLLLDHVKLGTYKLKI